MGHNVVFDVNVYIAAVADRDAPPLPEDLSVPTETNNPGLVALSVVMQGLRDGRFECALFSSHHVELNIVHVLKRKFGWPDKLILSYIELIRELIEFSGGERLEDTVTVVTDSDDHEDNAILALAADVSAELIVSNDTGLQHLSPWRGVPIIPADRFAALALGARGR